jgi:hypothetical protein
MNITNGNVRGGKVSPKLIESIAKSRILQFARYLQLEFMIVSVLNVLQTIGYCHGLN